MANRRNNNLTLTDKLAIFAFFALCVAPLALLIGAWKKLKAVVSTDG